MLKEIRCSNFNQEIIKFDSGLNVILGDSAASNSIGKTTTLMIIDFIFGGNSYITENNDTILNIGHHEFKFKFEFNNEYLYFKRETSNYEFVEICDDNYNEIDEISLNDYKELLSEKYKLSYLGKSFRTIVGNYSRIWGKDNYYVEKPLKQKDSKNDTAIINLIKLFNKYESIEKFENQFKKLDIKDKAIKKAITTELIPGINKKQYDKNINELVELDKKIARFKKNMNDFNFDVNVFLSEEMIELKNKKNELHIKQNHINNKIKRVELNLNSEDLKVNSKIDRLIEFFPSINVNKLKEINEFHRNMSNALKNQLKDELEKLKDLLSIVDSEIDLIDQKIKDKTNIKNLPEYNVDRLSDLITRKNNIEQMNIYYERKQIINGEVNKIKDDLKLIKTQIISHIVKQINIDMYDLFKRIYCDNRKSPTFSLDTETYSLRRENDTGTGSSYINLIAFDLSIFMETELPFIIHDSLLFKNVEDFAFENLIKIYNEFDKQIFISIDQINKFSENTCAILKNNLVVELDRKKTLFNKNWKLDN